MNSNLNRCNRNNPKILRFERGIEYFKLNYCNKRKMIQHTEKLITLNSLDLEGSSQSFVKQAEEKDQV